ncbi:hypothetical protein [Halobaculum saliterrae]|uniref:hypothetical protein n=1 Tax=Halobaculum saliterrae TaxID=2073113 RepID=UPI001F47544E|nr:hypothetical protein [Halobaculum saliterrae]
MLRDQPNDGVELPALEAGVTLLDVDTELGAEPLCALVLDQLLASGDHAFWVDAGDNVRTSTLATLAPHPQYLERITVARGFTAYQHASLLDRLPRIVSNAALERTDPALVVVPAMDLLYREDDIPREQARELLVQRLATLAGLARDRDLPVVLTRTRDDELSAPLEAAAEEALACRATPFGPRFTSDDAESDAETLVYHTGDGWLQTTLAFWREILQHRARAVDAPIDTAGDTPSASSTSVTSPVTPKGW